ncbi:DUF309 domain-containing protein [Geomonas sp. Red32]|uniref:DUF309 domain-containing protein n=1 Tax=Geomonas sp. Red32 TaxID=2912856 RepID=UPI00202CB5A6|nr:DUF309 domain-containing protein [Geomonas sp. Red32]MCM0084259.1 DUF309 domain-containing protein [Geomonas sp. Red32]
MSETESTPCLMEAPEELVRAVGEFNRREWFECHESLEELWVGSKGEIRHFYQGLLQFAVALYHWRDGNYSGAVLLLERAAGHLRHVQAVCQQVPVQETMEAADRLREALAALGPDRMDTLPPHLIPQLRLLPPRGNRAA